MKLRPVTDADIPAVLRINLDNVEVLAPMDEAKLRRKLAIAERFDVIEVDGVVAGFLVLYGPTAPYWSPNFEWFNERYDDLVYLDRIAIDPGFRRRGIASAVYDVLEAEAAPHGRMVLEAVDDNDGSLAFHAGRGYVEVGRFSCAGHDNVMLLKEL
jgi:predicted GNAT superfamily acetyltransferase